MLNVGWEMIFLDVSHQLKWITYLNADETIYDIMNIVNFLNNIIFEKLTFESTNQSATSVHR